MFRFPTLGSVGSICCMMSSITFCSSSEGCSSLIGSLSGISLRGLLFSKDSLGLPAAVLVFLDREPVRRGLLVGRSLSA